MKKLLVLLMVMLPILAVAESGFYYNPYRNGEGIFVTIDKENRISWAMFTYWDDTFNTAPPVSPKPPPSAIVANAAHNHPMFITGAGVYAGNAAIGKVYYSIADEYPKFLGYNLVTSYNVGSFLIEASGEGFLLAIDCNVKMPHKAHLCTEVFAFTDKLIGE